MRVLALSDHLGHAGGKVHGGTTYFVSVLPALKEAGVELTACFMAPPHPAADQLERRGLEPVFLSRPKIDPRAYGDVKEIVDRKKIQLVHLASYKSQYLGRLVAKRRGLRSIIHLHDTKPLPLPVRLLQKTVADHTDLALAVSDPVGELGVTEYGLPRHKVRTLPSTRRPFAGDPRRVLRNALDQNLDSSRGLIFSQSILLNLYLH